MNRRLHTSARVVIVALAAMLVLSQSALANSTYWSYGMVTTTYYLEYYATPRTTNISPYGIAFRRDGGQAVQMKWILCGSTGGGTLQGWNEADYGWHWLRANNPDGYSLTFCMAIGGYLNSYGSFSGLLDWDQ